MDRTIVRKMTLDNQTEAYCLSLSFDERLGVLEELNRQGRILMGYPDCVVMNRQVVRSSRSNMVHSFH